MNKSFVLTAAIRGAALLAAVTVAGCGSEEVSAALPSKAVVGEPAPAFTATDANGKAISLADFKGKPVVLEWTNPGCPFVRKHYDSGNMPATQAKALGKDVAWVTIQTSGDADALSDLTSWQGDKKSAPTTSVIDADGSLGRTYGARTTPHMYIVDAAGKLVYAGAIDSVPSADADDIEGATNYVNQALDETLTGKPVSKAVTEPYGCSVKYPG